MKENQHKYNIYLYIKGIILPNITNNIGDILNVYRYDMSYFNDL